MLIFALSRYRIARQPKWLRAIDGVVVEPEHERAAGHAELGGGAGLIAGVTGQRAQDALLLGAAVRR